jgi:hypothetical protein
VRSIEEECLDRIAPLGERHLRAVVGDLMVHYHEARNRRELGNELIAARPESKASAGPVRRQERVGGILNYYYREAA